MHGKKGVDLPMNIRMMLLIASIAITVSACESESIWVSSGGGGTGGAGAGGISHVGVITQITNSDSTTGGISIKGITDDGRYAAVLSNYDLANTRDGATADYSHLYVIDLTTKVATQIDNGTEVVGSARISADGSKVAYVNFAEELKTASLDGSNNLLIADIESGLFELSSDGKWIFIKAMLEKTATTKKYGIVKISSEVTLLPTTLVLTDPPAVPYDNVVWGFNIAFQSLQPPVSAMRVSSDGSTLIFQSNYDLLATTPESFVDGRYQLFSVNVDGTNQQQITSIDSAVTWHDANGTVPTIGPIEYPDISSDGSFAVFTSMHDLAGFNSANKAVPYRVDLASGIYTQLIDESIVKDVALNLGNSGPGMLSGDDQSILFTHLVMYKGSSSDTSLTELIGDSWLYQATPNQDAKTIIFLSTRDLTGDNVDKNEELFMLKW